MDKKQVNKTAIEEKEGISNQKSTSKHAISKLKKKRQEQPSTTALLEGVLQGNTTDYIERNALTHVALYQHLNNTLFSNGSSEKLVIVGPSMGGQMSRYALAYMEKHNIPHNTRLWVSIDSPHLGANIPIGIQSMMNLLDAFGGSVAETMIWF